VLSERALSEHEPARKSGLFQHPKFCAEIDVKLHFLGANRQVTGSRYCLEVGEERVFIDYGMVQERSFAERNWQPCPIDVSTVSAALLTHAHIDHCGMLPRMVAGGFEGPIYCTRPTAALTDIMLRDSARIQVEDAEQKTKRHRQEGRSDKKPAEALFDEADVINTLPLLESCRYDQPVQVTKNISATFYEAGHILGSAMLEVKASTPEGERILLFSGDIGQYDKPIIRDPTSFAKADYVVMESTYGDRDHREGGDITAQFEEVINRAISRGGNVVIPTFAVERAQELIYYIARLTYEKRIPKVRVFLDSPMAIDVTNVFTKHSDVFDEETSEMIIAGKPPLRFPGLSMSRTAHESREINRYDEPCIIMATSGMCTAGRIKHHLKRNIQRPESVILFVGYQARGTLGRHIRDGKKKKVRILGREYWVNAEIAEIHGFSGHADHAGLLRWVKAIDSPKQVFLTHGEESVALKFADELNLLGIKTTVPEYGDAVTLE